MKKRPLARIIGLGSYLPEKILTNQDLEKLVDTSDEWIVTRTGMKERRLAADDEFPSDMGAKAALKALSAADIDVQAVDLILVATMTPDYISPSTGNLIQTKIGATRAFSMDIQAACTGFLYVLSIAKAYVESGAYGCVLVVASEKMSAFMDYTDRNTCILFGDGAAAAVVTGEGEGLAIKTLNLGSDGALADLVIIPGGGSRHPATKETVEQGAHYFKMSGAGVFKHAVRKMSESAKECLLKEGLEEKDISWLVPHQANERIMDALAKHFNISQEKVFKTVHKYGNTSASSVAIALDELTQEHTLKSGENLLLTAVGGGLTWGACILTKVTE